MIRSNTSEKPSKNRFFSTTSTTTRTTSPSSFRAPSKDANIDNNRSRHNYKNEICDETWPLDDMINKIELRSDLSSDVENYDHNNKAYNIETQQWHSGPKLISNNFDSGRNVERLPGHGQIISSWNQGSTTWKDKSVKHRKYKTKKSPTRSFDKSYDVNNNYLDLDISYDNELEFCDDDDDKNPLSSVLLRDVGIQCNLNKKLMNKTILPTEIQSPTIVRSKPPIKVIKSSNNGIVSTFSDVPKLSSPSPIPDLDLDYDHSSIHSNNYNNSNNIDAIYSQIDKSHKNNRNNGNINIVYKQPLNDDTNKQSLNNSLYDIKTKEYGFNVNNPNFRKIQLPNPNDSILSTMSTTPSGSLKKQSSKMKKDKEILEETISISNSSTTTEESFVRNSTAKSIDPRIDLSLPRYLDDNDMNNSNLKAAIPSPETRRIKNKQNHIKSSNNNTINDEENEWLENNSLRLKSSKPQSSFTGERLHKSNADLREQFLHDETRGGLAAAYKNRQQLHNQKNSSKHPQQPQQQQNRRTLSLNRMNASIGNNNGDNVRQLSNQQQQQQQPHYIKPYRHQSQTNLGSRYSDLSADHLHHHHHHHSGNHAPRSISSSRSRSIQHERDPIVMYIPPVNQQLTNEQPKLTSILRNNSTKSNVTIPTSTLTKGRSKSTSKQPQLKSQSKVNLKDIVYGDDKNNNSSTSRKRNDLNRRYSMPKDTKFNWLNKFKLKK